MKPLPAEPHELDEVVHGDRIVRLLRREVVFDNNGNPLVVELSEPIGPAHRTPVVLVHGFAQNRFSWHISERSFVGALVDAGYVVHNLELRGHGRSRDAGSGNATNFMEYVEDLMCIVKECDRPPFCIGHSLGGAVVAGVAGRVPVAGIISVAGIFSFASSNASLRALCRLTAEFAPHLRGRARLSTGWAGGLIGKLYRVTDVAGFGFPLAGWAPGSIERHLLEERLRIGFDWTSIDVWLEMCSWATGQANPALEGFSKADVPLLVLAGDLDPLVRESDTRAAVAASGSEDSTHVLFDAFEHEVHWGHADLIFGTAAPRHTWPVMVDWMNGRRP